MQPKVAFLYSLFCVLCSLFPVLLSRSQSFKNNKMHQGIGRKNND